MDMSKSQIIVALALGGLQFGVFAQQSLFADSVMRSDQALDTILAASGGNPWAMPDSTSRYEYVDPMKQPAPKPERPKYITPEELKQLDRLPPEPQTYEPAEDPGRYGPGYYGRGYYPSGSYYGAPQGTGPLYDPYGGSYVVPYGGILPFLY